MIYGGLVNSLENRPPLRYHHRWRGGRVVEGAPLLREYALIAYRGFESLPLRHHILAENYPIKTVYLKIVLAEYTLLRQKFKFSFT